MTEETACYDIDAIVNALGGNDNIVNVSMCSLTRLDVELKAADKVSSSTLFALGIDGCITLNKHLVQLLVMQSPETLLAELNSVSSHC